MNKILLVEDDKNLGYILREYLEMNGFSVDWTMDGESGERQAARQAYDLCILDVMMPKKDGFTLAAGLKQNSPSLPIIFLTSKSLKIDKLKGFKLGADDYIVKPVDEEELIARIHAVLRRSSPDTISRTYQFAIGSYQYDIQNHELSINGEVQHLTQKENQVLELLCNDLGRLVNRDIMLRQLWGDAGYFKRRSMDVVISKLRKYLQHDPRIRIANVHGQGYILKVEGST